MLSCKLLSGCWQCVPFSVHPGVLQRQDRTQQVHRMPYRLHLRSGIDDIDISAAPGLTMSCHHPQAGLSFPVICPAGSVCNEPGLQVPATSCPPGYHCWEGTETADWNSESRFKPIACPKAVYCLGGITSNITNENDYLSPQPCTLGQYCKEASTSPFGTGAFHAQCDLLMMAHML